MLHTHLNAIREELEKEFPESMEVGITITVLESMEVLTDEELDDRVKKFGLGIVENDISTFILGQLIEED